MSVEADLVRLKDETIALARAIGDDVETLSNRVGDMNNLQTHNKSSLVSSINEVKEEIALTDIVSDPVAYYILAKT